MNDNSDLMKKIKGLMIDHLEYGRSEMIINNYYTSFSFDSEDKRKTLQISFWNTSYEYSVLYDNRTGSHQETESIPKLKKYFQSIGLKIDPIY